MYDSTQSSTATGVQPYDEMSSMPQPRVTKKEDGMLEPKRPMRSESPDGPRWWFMAVCAILTGLYAGYFALGSPHGDPSVKERIMGSIPGKVHIVGGGLGVLIGPIQFLKSVRYKQIGVHIWVGRLYTLCIVGSAIGAYRVSADAMCYKSGKIGFALLASVWLVTIVVGMDAIWKGNVAKHRAWLMRNFALTYAAVSLRPQLVAMILSGVESELALNITAYSCWIPNLLFVEWWLRRKSPKVVTY